MFSYRPLYLCCSSYKCQTLFIGDSIKIRQHRLFFSSSLFLFYGQSNSPRLKSLMILSQESSLGLCLSFVWLKYCRCSVKHYPINQSSNLIFNDLHFKRGSIINSVIHFILCCYVLMMFLSSIFFHERII